MPALSNEMILPLLLFLGVIVLMIAISNWRWLVAMIGAVAFVILRILPAADVLPAIDWNVIMMIAGTMGTVSLFIWSRMPSRLADQIINRVPNEKWAIVALSVFAGIISAFVDNTATVLMVAPIAITICKKLDTSPVPMVISIAIASNLEGAATLVGDTTSIMLGGALDMTFLDFFWYHNRPSLFFVVQVGLILATGVLLIMFRKKDQPLMKQPVTEVSDYVPTVLLAGTIAALIIASLLPLDDWLPASVVSNINGIICMAIFVIGLIIELLRNKGENLLKVAVDGLDWQTLVQLSSLFVLIAGITQVGIIRWLAELIHWIGGNSVFGMYTIIVWASVLISAFIDNIPYVATMLPVVGSLSVAMGVDPTVFYFGLLCGATLGGNLTPIGASANVAGIGILRKNGHSVPAGTFMKVSVPYTLVAVTSAYIGVWFLFRPV